jgi:hypothetical protein
LASINDQIYYFPKNSTNQKKVSKKLASDWLDFQKLENRLQIDAKLYQKIRKIKTVDHNDPINQTRSNEHN